MAVERPLGSIIDFMRNTISGSAARFFVIIVESFFTLIYEIKIFEIKNESFLYRFYNIYNFHLTSFKA